VTLSTNRVCTLCTDLHERVRVRAIPLYRSSTDTAGQSFKALPKVSDNAPGWDVGGLVGKEGGEGEAHGRTLEGCSLSSSSSRLVPSSSARACAAASCSGVAAA